MRQETGSQGMESKGNIIRGEIKRENTGIPLWFSGLRIQLCHYRGWVAAVMWVPSLAQKLSYATGEAKEKQNKTKLKQKVLLISFLKFIVAQLLLVELG